MNAIECRATFGVDPIIVWTVKCTLEDGVRTSELADLRAAVDAGLISPDLKRATPKGRQAVKAVCGPPTDSLTRDDMHPAPLIRRPSKSRALYQVRYWVGMGSAHVGFKMRLLPRPRALACVRFLRARGVDAYAARVCSRA